MKIRAITLWQPWASLVAIGAKKIETRGWATPYRGPLAIHAGQKRDLQATREYLEGNPFAADALDSAGFDVFSKLPFGAVIAIVELVDVVRVEDLLQRITPIEESYGDYRPDRYGWQLENLNTFERPVPCRGAQGLWEWTVPADLADDLSGLPAMRARR